MRQTINIVIFLIALVPFSMCAHAQYIDEILDYKPAPGQFINLISSGTTEAAQSISGPNRGLVSLGAAGGYIIFRFSSPVVNNPDHPYGVDFTLFGNPLPEWSEPGIVWVMKDENQNGLPDDTWIELAGSDHFFSSTRYGHEQIYYQPMEEKGAILWRDNAGSTGTIFQNSFHSQSYYPYVGFPSLFYADSCSFTGTLIAGNSFNDPVTGSKSFPRHFGYADNHASGDLSSSLPDNPYTQVIEGYGGDAFDLSWAYLPGQGYTDIDTAHFIMVQTSMKGISGVVGEISTELSGGTLSVENRTEEYENRLLLLDHGSGELPPGEYNFSAYYFENGRYFPTEKISWISMGSGNSVDDSGNIMVSPETDLEIYAIAKGGEVISETIHVKYGEPLGSSTDILLSRDAAHVYPNPAGEFIYLYTSESFEATIYDITGRMVLSQLRVSPGEPVDISMLNAGLYSLSYFSGGIHKTLSFIKR